MDGKTMKGRWLPLGVKTYAGVPNPMVTALVALTLMAIGADGPPASQKWFPARLFSPPQRILKWDDGAPAAPVQVLVVAADDPDLATLRTKYELEKIVVGAADDYDALRRILKWTHDRWKHSGNNEPSKLDPLTILDQRRIVHTLGRPVPLLLRLQYGPTSLQAAW